jgi:hypothetical protein
MRVKLLILFIVFSKLSLSQEYCEDDFLKYPLKSISKFCQKDSTKSISKQVLNYNQNNKLSQSSTYFDNVETYRTIYKYNSKGLLTSKEFYYLIPVLKLKRTRVFKYNSSDLLIYEGFDDVQGNNTKYSYQYNSNGLLTGSSLECNYTNWTYTYEYDLNDILIKRFKNNNLEIMYENQDEKLVMQTNFFMQNETLTEFEYNENDKLVIKKENGKIVERNIYKANLLLKKWTYYFGIDPCFDLCCSQYLTKYDYYQTVE